MKDTFTLTQKKKKKKGLVFTQPPCWYILFIPCVAAQLFLCLLETVIHLSFATLEGIKELVLDTPASHSPAFGSLPGIPDKNNSSVFKKVR